MRRRYWLHFTTQKLLNKFPFSSNISNSDNRDQLLELSNGLSFMYNRLKRDIKDHEDLFGLYNETIGGMLNEKDSLLSELEQGINEESDIARKDFLSNFKKGIDVPDDQFLESIFEKTENSDKHRVTLSMYTTVKDTFYTPFLILFDRFVSLYENTLFEHELEDSEQDLDENYTIFKFLIDDWTNLVIDKYKEYPNAKKLMSSIISERELEDLSQHMDNFSGTTDDIPLASGVANWLRDIVRK